MSNELDLFDTFWVDDQGDAVYGLMMTEYGWSIYWKDELGEWCSILTIPTEILEEVGNIVTGRTGYIGGVGQGIAETEIRNEMGTGAKEIPNY